MRVVRESQNIYYYMDDPAAKAFSYWYGNPNRVREVGLYPSMYHRNHNMMTARLRYRDAVRRVFRGRDKYGKYRHSNSAHHWKSNS